MSPHRPSDLAADWTSLGAQWQALGAQWQALAAQWQAMGMHWQMPGMPMPGMTMPGMPMPGMPMPGMPMPGMPMPGMPMPGMTMPGMPMSGMPMPGMPMPGMPMPGMPMPGMPMPGMLAPAAPQAASGASTPAATPAPFHTAVGVDAEAIVAIPSLLDPAALTELNERYQRRFQALWVGAFAERAPAGAEGVREDRRFAAPEWREQPYFRWLKDAYLLHADYVREFAGLAQVDAPMQRRLRFLAAQYADAVAPSNFLATNPEALKLAFDSGGQSLLQGLSNLVGDARRGRIAMTDEQAFHVGENLAVTPGRVIFRNELIEVLQYDATTPEVRERPLLMVPPCINKFYILDLKPANSFVRYAVDSGHTVLMISWRNIPSALGALTWDDYLQQGVMAAIGVAREAHRGALVNMLGFCVGGTLLASALAVEAARGALPVASATFLTTMLDFEDPGDIGVYVSAEALASRKPRLCAGARVQGSELAAAFASLRPNELVWNYVVNNYLKGKTPPPFDLLYWNGDGSNLPGPMYAYYLEFMYIGNRLRDRDALTMCGERIDLSRVDTPAYILASRDDHIVPWRSAYRSVGLLGGDKTFVLGASGHIAGVINPPADRKRNYWTNEQLGPDPDAWLATATTVPGSWWPHWMRWLDQHAGATVAARSISGKGHARSLGPAPGQYVVERAD